MVAFRSSLGSISGCSPQTKRDSSLYEGNALFLTSRCLERLILMPAALTEGCEAGLRWCKYVSKRLRSYGCMIPLVLSLSIKKYRWYFRRQLLNSLCSRLQGSFRIRTTQLLAMLAREAACKGSTSNLIPLSRGHSSKWGQVLGTLSPFLFS